jgi:hypothetical protein
MAIHFHLASLILLATVPLSAQTTPATAPTASTRRRSIGGWIGKPPTSCCTGSHYNVTLTV